MWKCDQWACIHGGQLKCICSKNGEYSDTGVKLVDGISGCLVNLWVRELHYRIAVSALVLCSIICSHKSH